MSEIRMRLHLGTFRLEYSGSLAFYQRVLEPLLGGPAVRAPLGSGGERAEPTGPVPATGVAPTSTAAPVPTFSEPAPPAPRAAAPLPDRGYRPPSAEFGPFVQRLGSEAAEPDRQVVAFAFFLWNYAKKDVIAEEEIAGCFRALGLPPPANLPDLAFGVAQRLRFLAPGPSAGTWTLTTKGANYVKTRLLGGA